MYPFWVLADSTAPNPAYTYTNAGTYTVSLTATGPGGTNTPRPHHKHNLGGLGVRSNTTQWATVVLKEQPGGGLYELYANGDRSQPLTSVTVGGQYRVLSAGPWLLANQWTHLAATYDGTTQKALRRRHPGRTMPPDRAHPGVE